MLESLHHHAEVVDAIRTGNGNAAARLARQNMFDYYAGYVPDSEQGTLRALIED
jgi:DNA-binding GntR family transcriptional regulator